MIFLTFVLILKEVFASNFVLKIQQSSIAFHKEALVEFRNQISKVTYNVTSDSLEKRLNCGPFLQITPNETFFLDYQTEETIPFNSKISIKIKIFGQQFKGSHESQLQLYEKKQPQPGQHIIVYKFIKNKFSTPYLLENTQDFNEVPTSKFNFHYMLRVQVEEVTNQTESQFRGRWCKIEEIKEKQNKYISVLKSWIYTYHFKISAAIAGVFIVVFSIGIYIFNKRSEDKDLDKIKKD